MFSNLKRQYGRSGEATTIPWRIYALIFLLGLSIIGTVVYGYLTGLEMNRVHAALVDAASQIKYEATSAHLWLEEHLHEKDAISMDTVWRHLDRAAWYANAMIEGGKRPTGAIVPLQDAELRETIKEVQAKLARFRGITDLRIWARETSTAGSSIDQRYNAIFKNFITQADQVKNRLQQHMSRDLRNFQITQYVLIGSCVCLFLAIGVTFHRFERRRAQDYLILQDAHEHLELEMDQRKRAQENVSRLTQQLITAQEMERRHISHELHDCVAQELSAIKMGLGTMRYGWPQAPPEVKASISELSSQLKDALNTVRYMAYDLRPPGLDELGVVQAIEQHCEDFSERTGIPVRFVADHIETRPRNIDTETILFRLVQEALNNVRKHADAKMATVRLGMANGRITLAIKDDGVGFDVDDALKPTSRGEKMGLRIMQERASLISGNLTFESIPGKGVSIVLDAPYRETSDE